MEARVLRASRFKWAVLFLASAVFAAAGLLIFFAAAGGRVGGAVVLVFFGACALIAAVQLLFGSYLILARDGFTVSSLGRRVTRRWQDVEGFVVVRPSAFTEIVGIRFTASQQSMSKVRRLARDVAGYEGALPDTYGMKAADLAALMEEWRARRSDSNFPAETS